MLTIVPFLPEIFLFSLAIIILILDWYIQNKKLLGLLTSFGLFLILVYIIKYPVSYAYISGYISDGISFYSKVLILIAGFLVALSSISYKPMQKKNQGEFFALIVFMCLGVVLISSTVDLIMIYVSLEFISLTSYVLAAYLKEDAKSAESSLKYFLFGAATSAFMIYGMSIAYGLTGSTNLLQILRFSVVQNFHIYLLSIVLMLIGFGFKIGMVPVHFWIPDVYEGAPTPVAQFFSAAPKIGGFALLIRFLSMLIPVQYISASALFAGISALTMFAGNLSAIPQNNIKRLLGYSSIAQAGYIIIALSSLNSSFALPAIFIYLLAYILATVGAFCAVIAVSNSENSDDLDAYSGLSKKSPFTALCISVFFLSLIGIPPLAGFIGKFYLFASAIDQNMLWLAVLGVINSVVSLYYYFKVVKNMYFLNPKDNLTLSISAPLSLVLAICLIGTFAIGIFPQLLIDFIRNYAVVFVR